MFYEFAIDARLKKFVIRQDVRSRPRLADRGDVMIDRTSVELAVLIVVQPGHARFDAAVLVEDTDSSLDDILHSSVAAEAWIKPDICLRTLGQSDGSSAAS